MKHVIFALGALFCAVHKPALAQNSFAVQSESFKARLAEIKKTEQMHLSELDRNKNGKIDASERRELRRVIAQARHVQKEKELQTLKNDQVKRADQMRQLPWDKFNPEKMVKRNGISDAQNANQVGKPATETTE